MDPITAIGAIAAACQLIKQTTDLVIELRALYESIKNADMHLLSVIAQLNTMKSALEQIEVLAKSSAYEEQVCGDLNMSVQACEMHVAVLGEKLAGLKLKKAANGMILRSKIKVVFESKGMGETLTRLNHQAMALNLLISVLTSRSVTEQKNLLQRSTSRRIFKQVEDDAATVHSLHDDTPLLTYERSNSEPVLAKASRKRFSFDRLLMSTRTAQKSFHDRTQSMGKHAIAEVSELAAEEGESSTMRSETPDRNTSGIPPTLAEDMNLRFYRVLAFSHLSTTVEIILGEAQLLWADPGEIVQRPQASASAVYSLKTRYFDVRVHSRPLDSSRTNEGFQDVSTILFAMSLHKYCTMSSGEQNLTKDLEFFNSVINDYHLCLANVVLFLDTSALYEAPKVSIASVRARFLEVGRWGNGADRIRVHIGEPDQAAAAAIFTLNTPLSRTQSYT